MVNYSFRNIASELNAAYSLFFDMDGDRKDYRFDLSLDDEVQLRRADRATKFYFQNISNFSKDQKISIGTLLQNLSEVYTIENSLEEAVA